MDLDSEVVLRLGGLSRCCGARPSCRTASRLNSGREGAISRFPSLFALPVGWSDFARRVRGGEASKRKKIRNHVTQESRS
jgi:hypothetical protein